MPGQARSRPETAGSEGSAALKTLDSSGIAGGGVLTGAEEGTSSKALLRKLTGWCWYGANEPAEVGDVAAAAAAAAAAPPCRPNAIAAARASRGENDRRMERRSPVAARCLGAVAIGSDAGIDAPPILPPAFFFCGISKRLMKQPVSMSDGHLYEWHVAVKWIRQHGSSPVTGKPLGSGALVPAPEHMAQIRRWLEHHSRHVRLA